MQYFFYTFILLNNVFNNFSKFYKPSNVLSSSYVSTTPIFQVFSILWLYIHALFFIFFLFYNFYLLDLNYLNVSDFTINSYYHISEFNYSYIYLYTNYFLIILFNSYFLFFSYKNFLFNITLMLYLSCLILL